MFLKINRKILYLIALCFILSLFNTKNVYAKENEAVFGNEITITFVGDCTLGTYLGQSPGNRFDEVYNENGSKYFFSNVYSIFNNDDITLVNLEGPLTSEKQTAIKKFPIKGEAEMINATPMVKEENENENENEKQTKPDFRLDLSILKESLRVPTNWIGRE